ncbi:HlyC/CorC family transporter [Actinomyces sp. 432]|uniref:hemolysin family protein n=1 Tax=Actinomyces sp. 432 TaxID=2057798 RepID=UPI0013743030|nr:hemolysin family protein [Actinomyces sp. 432]QHO91136.1 HlyC/CorC family transporter [Actinomyces sp. 432]
MTAAPSVLLLLAAVVALGFGMALSAGEGALTRMTRAAAEDLAEAGRRGAERVVALTSRREQVLGTLVGLRAGVDMLVAVLVTLGVAGHFEKWWQVLLVAIGLNLVLLGLLVGVSPRSAGRRNPAGTLLALAGLLERVDALGAPWRWLQARFGHAAALTDAELRAEVTEDLREMIDEIGDSETIEDEDREMMRSVVELGQTLVREVMVPRTDMVTIDEDKPTSAGMRLFIRSGYSRVPVIGEDADDVHGILYLKDVLRRLSDHPEYWERPVSAFTREAVYVPETKLADDLLREMQLGHFHIALAVDEYGGIAGLVTLEDLLEEVVGELTDEHDPAEPVAEDLGDGTFRVPVRLGLDALGELFDLEIEDDDVDTAGGLLTKAIGRVPLPGASGDVQGIHLVAEEATGRRRQVATLLASRSASAPSQPRDAAAAGSTAGARTDHDRKEE